MSDSLEHHGLQHTSLPSLSPTHGTCSNSCPCYWWCHPTISSSHPFLLLPSIFTSHRVFSNESVLHIRCSKCWSFSFSISPSNVYTELISFRIDWLNLLAVQESSPTPQFKSINSSAPSFLCGSSLMSIHDYWKNHRFDHTDFLGKVLLFNT